MNPLEYCSSCNEAVQWKCSRCEKEGDRSVHTSCGSIARNVSNIVIVLQSVISAACISGLTGMPNLS